MLFRFGGFLLFTLLSVPTCAQVKIREYTKGFQVSLFPGISTNGLYSGSYYNKVSLNIFGGLSAGTTFLEIGVLSNLNLKKSNGIQLAGLANVVGSNAFVNLTLWEERELIRDGFESSFTGIQTAGMLNYVRSNFSGIQLSGLFNVVGVDARGFQLAGLGNGVRGATAGMQLAGLYNISRESMGGFQISALFNHTNGKMAGGQFGLVNRAHHVIGRKSTPPTTARGLQIGLINMSKKMDGLQIGLINMGGSARGTQIALINFFSKYPSKENTRMGTPIGLLNIGSKGSYFRFFYNELFSTNIEYTTGNCLNCTWIMGSEMPYNDSYKIFNQNALILGYDYFQKTWGFGYGFQKVLYNKFVVMPHKLNERKMITYGIRFIHLNRDMTVDRNFNLITRLNVDFGKRWKSTFIFAGVSLNYFLQQPEDGDVYNINSLVIDTGKVGNLVSAIWPGYNVGLQF